MVSFLFVGLTKHVTISALLDAHVPPPLPEAPLAARHGCRARGIPSTCCTTSTTGPRCATCCSWPAGQCLSRRTRSPSPQRLTPVPLSHRTQLGYEPTATVPCSECTCCGSFVLLCLPVRQLMANPHKCTHKYINVYAEGLARFCAKYLSPTIFFGWLD